MEEKKNREIDSQRIIALSQAMKMVPSISFVFISGCARNVSRKALVTRAGVGMFGAWVYEGASCGVVARRDLPRYTLHEYEHVTR